MENYALAHGISGSRWLDEKPFDYMDLTLDDGQREALRKKIKSFLKGRREFSTCGLLKKCLQSKQTKEILYI